MKGFKSYSVESCLRKSDHHSEVGSLAAADGDHANAKRHFKLSDIWYKRAQDGGYAQPHKRKKS